MTTKRNKLSQEDSHYNDEALFLEGVIAFHPQVFNALKENEQTWLTAYYGLEASPSNIFTYRATLLERHPELETNAKSAFDALLKSMHITHFSYTTVKGGVARLKNNFLP